MSAPKLIKYRGQVYKRADLLKVAVKPHEDITRSTNLPPKILVELAPLVDRLRNNPLADIVKQVQSKFKLDAAQQREARRFIDRVLEYWRRQEAWGRQVAREIED